MELLEQFPSSLDGSKSESERMVNLALGQSQVLEMVAMGNSLSVTLDALLRFLEDDTPEMFCSVLLLDPDGVHLRHCAAPRMPEAYIKAIDGAAIGPCAGSCGTAAFRGERVIVTDIQSDPLWENYRHLILPHGFRASWSIPILNAEGKVLGTFAMYFRTPRSPEALHQRIIEIALHVASLAIGTDYRERERCQLTQALEERVKQLTVTRQIAQQLLVERPMGQELFDDIVQIIPLGLRNPTECRARIVYDTWESMSDGYVESPWKLVQKISTSRGEGSMEVVCLEEPAGGSEPFLIEERQLLESVAGTIAVYLNRIEAEEALFENAERYRLLNLATSDVVWDWDVRKNTLWWNNGVHSLLGYRMEDVPEDLTWWSDRLHPDDRERVALTLQRAAESEEEGGCWNEDYRFLRADGSYAEVLDRGYVMRDAAGVAVRMIGVMQDVTKRKKAEAKVRELAYQEALTRLPNRTALQQRLARAIEQAETEQHELALILVNLNYFRDINDCLGHQNGDILLQRVAERLCRCVGDGGEVASLGGDEFAILLPRLERRADVEAMLQDIQEALRQPVQVADVPIKADSSMGIALFPEHGTKLDLLWQHADVALRTAKERYETHLFYSSSFDHYDPARLILLGELRGAIDDGQLVLHYQPKIDVASGRTIGVEALVRWAHPSRGLIFPDSFIPMAERTDLINSLTTCVVVDALREGVALLQEGYSLDVSVNLSARNLHEPGFSQGLLQLVGSVGFPLSRLTLEVTETAIMTDPVRAKAVLSELHDAGIHLSMDDFGIGQSSLTYLKELPITKMKIDKSFVMDFEQPRNVAVVRSAIDLARNMGLQVTAEGVEQEATFLALKDFGCELAQGYFFSKALPVDGLKRWLGESPWGCDYARHSEFALS